jgi:hypothetical protein
MSARLLPMRRTRGGRQMAPAPAPAPADEPDADECPVCMTAYDPAEGRPRVRFPCGHTVCAACDARMRDRAFHTCPTCRTPREGVTRAQADLAAQSRVLADQARERSENPSAAGVSGVVEHNGNQYEILFFASQAEGDPFDVLRTVAPPARSRRFRIDDGDHPRFHQPVDALDEEEQVEELQRQQGPPPAEAVELGGPLGALVHELMQPGDLSTFLARHEVARRTATAENSRPASRGTRMLAAAERQLAAAARRGDRSAVL